MKSIPCSFTCEPDLLLIYLLDHVHSVLMTIVGHSARELCLEAQTSNWPG